MEVKSLLAIETWKRHGDSLNEDIPVEFITISVACEATSSDAWSFKSPAGPIRGQSFDCLQSCFILQFEKTANILDNLAINH
jgi:hypothetical protein